MDAYRQAHALARFENAGYCCPVLRMGIVQAEGYSTIATIFAREAESRVTEITQHIQEATGYYNAAVYELQLANYYRNEAIDRRTEAWSILKDRSQFIGDFTQSAMKQMPS